MASPASWSHTAQHHAWSGRVLCNAVQTTLKGRIRVDFTGWPFTSAFFGALAKSESERNACSVERRNELIALKNCFSNQLEAGHDVHCLVWAQSVNQTEHERHLVPSNSTDTLALLMWPVSRRSFLQLLNQLLCNYFKQLYNDWFWSWLLFVLTLYKEFCVPALASILRLSWNLCNRLQLFAIVCNRLQSWKESKFSRWIFTKKSGVLMDPCRRRLWNGESLPLCLLLRTESGLGKPVEFGRPSNQLSFRCQQRFKGKEIHRSSIAIVVEVEFHLFLWIYNRSYTAYSRTYGGYFTMVVPYPQPPRFLDPMSNPSGSLCTTGTTDGTCATGGANLGFHDVLMPAVDQYLNTPRINMDPTWSLEHDFTLGYGYFDLFCSGSMWNVWSLIP